MASHIGGRLEAVPPRRSLFGPDYLRLAALLAASLGVHAWLLGHTAMTARDAIGFARYAMTLERPDLAGETVDASRTAIDVIRQSEHPPGYPAAVWVAGRAVRAATDLPVPEAMLRGAQFANALAGILLVVPTYILGRMLFGRDVGFAAALLVQVLPVFARATTDGLSEGVYLLSATTALALGVRALRRPGIGPFLLTGMAVGGAYLVRPEGLLLAAAVGTVGVALAAVRRWPRDVALARLTALAVGLALVAGPYALAIGRLTNKTTARQLFTPTDGPSGPIWRGQPTSLAPACGAPLLAVWWDEAVDGGSSRLLWAARGVVREVGKTAFYAPALLGLFGLLAYRRRVLADPGLAACVLLAGSYAAVLLYMGTTKGYVSERHTVVVALVLCLFAAASAGPLTAALARLPGVGRLWAGPYAPASLLLALVAVALPSTLKPLHEHRVGHRHAGEFLARHVQPGETVIDPFCWAEWYAGRSLYRVPADAGPGEEKARWAVLESSGSPSPHSRLPRLADAVAVRDDRSNPPEVAYHWPEDLPVGRAQVLVYRQAVRPR